MRILIVSQYYWPETFLINEVVDSLIALGCDVSVLTGQPNYPEGQIFEGYSAIGFGTQDRPGYKIYRVPVYPRRQGAINRVLNYFSFVLSAGLLGQWLLRGKKFDVVFVYAVSPILQGIPGIILRASKGAALVIWVQDLWPDSLKATGFVSNPFALSLIARLTRFIYQKSDLLLAQSRSFVDKIVLLAGSGVRVAFHPNPGQDVDPSNQVSTLLKLQPGFNVVFAGNLGSVQALETILDAAIMISDPEVRIVIVGSGSRSEWIQEQILSRRIMNVQLVGRRPKEEIPSILMQSSALLVTLNRSDALSLTIPSKVSSYMAAARPIIASLDGEAADIVRQSGAGIAVPAEDSAALAAAILELKKMSICQRDIMASNGRNYYESHFAPEPLARKLVQHFHTAIQTRTDVPSRSI